MKCEKCNALNCTERPLFGAITYIHCPYCDGPIKEFDFDAELAGKTKDSEITKGPRRDWWGSVKIDPSQTSKEWKVNDWTLSMDLSVDRYTIRVFQTNSGRQAGSYKIVGKHDIRWVPLGSSKIGTYNHYDKKYPDWNEAFDSAIEFAGI